MLRELAWTFVHWDYSFIYFTFFPYRCIWSSSITNLPSEEPFFQLNNKIRHIQRHIEIPLDHTINTLITLPTTLNVVYMFSEVMSTLWEHAVSKLAANVSLCDDTLKVLNTRNNDCKTLWDIMNSWQEPVKWNSNLLSLQKCDYIVIFSVDGKTFLKY